MSSRTKIVVLRMKELLYTLVFAALGLVFVSILVILISQKPAGDNTTTKEGVTTEEQVNAGDAEGAKYLPGVYTTELVLGSDSVEVEVVTTKDAITSITLKDVDDDIRQLYPLLESTFASIRDQIYETGSVEDVTYDQSSKYTSLVIIEAIKNSLQKAQP